MSSPRSRGALTSCAIAARSVGVAVEDEDRLFGSLGIELTPVIVSVIGDQPSPPATLACRAGNTVHRTAPDPIGLSSCRHPTSIWDGVGSLVDCVSKGDLEGGADTVATVGLRTTSTVIAGSATGRSLSLASRATGISLGGCISGSAFGGPDVTGSLCYYATPSGESGVTAPGGLGVGGPAGANLLVGPSVSNAENLSDFEEWFLYGGASAGEAQYGAGVQGQIGKNGCGRTIWSATAGWAPSLQLGVGGEAGVSYTRTYT